MHQYLIFLVSLSVVLVLNLPTEYILTYIWSVYPEDYNVDLDEQYYYSSISILAEELETSYMQNMWSFEEKPFV